MGRWGLVLCALLTGCIRSELVPCGDQLCPASSVCVTGDRCATTDQITACTNHDEGDTCTVGGSVGRCEQGICIATGCGNSKVEPGEACDDGNAISGDGCRADCAKVEMCGDAIVDQGESCDDGNTNPADGCDACTATTWRATAVLAGTVDPTLVGFSGPEGVAVDLDGNVYVADSANAVVRRIDTNGNIIIFAGTGIGGFGGDGGLASSAELVASSLATDGLGNVYIAGGGRVRRVAPSGIITTIAGGGAIDADGILATTAVVTTGGIAVDGLGRLYIASGTRVRRVNLDGTIETVVGSTSGGFSGDNGPATSAKLSGATDVELDAAGNLYIADGLNERVRRVDLNGTITTYAGSGTQACSGDGGPATSAALPSPASLAFDPQGNLYITGAYGSVRRVSAMTGVITSVYGTCADTGYAPASIAVDLAGNLYMLYHWFPALLYRQDTNGNLALVAGNTSYGYVGEGGGATSARLNTPSRVAVDSQRDIFIADVGGCRVLRVDPYGTLTTYAGTGQCGYSGDGAKATAAMITSPWALAVDATGNLYIGDSGNSRVRRVDTTGIITTFAGGGTSSPGDGGPATSAQLSYPEGLAFDSLGRLLIADAYDYRIRRVDAMGVITTIAGNGTAGHTGDNAQATNAELNTPLDVAVDTAGNIYIPERDSGDVRRVAPNGVITTFAGTPGSFGDSGDNAPATSATLDYPQAVAVDASGNVYIADAVNYRVRVVDSTGTIKAYAGTINLHGFDGDGGAPGAALLAEPDGLTFDSSGNLYIADGVNNDVRKIVGSTIMTVAGSIDPEGMGPAPHAHLVDAHSITITPTFTLFAGGSSGTVQALNHASSTLQVVAGRYSQDTAVAASARFRDGSFGTVSGLAFDAANGRIYITESSKNALHVITMVDPADNNTWTIQALVTSPSAGFADGPLASARFRNPTGLYYDPGTAKLYVADTGNHVIREIDLANGIASATIKTIAGTPQMRGFLGEGVPANEALLYAPQAITRCPNGDLFVADTANQRVRRVAADQTIGTVLGDGVAASSGEGTPAKNFPVNGPLGLACDDIGNLFVTSTSTIRMLPANANGIVDGSGPVQTIYGSALATTFPENLTHCLTGISVAGADTVEIVDSCAGLLVKLHREPR